MKDNTVAIEYRLVRSKRKTIGIEITPEGEVIVRAPLRAPKYVIEDALKTRGDWIEKHLQEMRERKEEREKTLADMEPITSEDMRRMSKEMLKEFPPRVKEFADILGVSYGRITIRNQRTRWGSCSAKGNLNFNCLLMEMSKEIQDYVIVHELCHRIEMNHSKKFWELVESVLPDYRQTRKQLKKEGELVLLRAFG